MKIIINKKEFGAIIQSVFRYCEKRAGVTPALSGIALIAGSDGIKVRATNLETGIDMRIPGTIEEQGVVLVSGSVLKDIAGTQIGSQPLTLTTKGDQLIVSSGKSKSTIKTLSYDDFPGLSLPEKTTTSLTLSNTHFKDLVGAVSHCASQSTIRPELASVLIKVEGGAIKAVATDSFRLAEKTLPLKKSVDSFQLLIPAKNLLDIIQTLPDGECTIESSDHQCVLRFKEGVITTRLIQANYPDYEQIIPKAFSTTATLPKKDFEQLLKQTAVFSDTFQKIKISFGSQDKNITLSAKNNDVGETEEVVHATVVGDSIELAFNHRYLLAPLSYISGETLKLESAGIGRPLILSGSNDTSYRYLVMPMNQ